MIEPNTWISGSAGRSWSADDEPSHIHIPRRRRVSRSDRGASMAMACAHPGTDGYEAAPLPTCDSEPLGR